MKTCKFISLFLVFLLTACATKPAPETPVNEVMPLEKREAKTATVTSWTLSGAIAAKTNNKAWSASINWRQQGADNYQIRLSGPLSSGTVLVEKSGGTVTYQDGPKKVSSSNADELLFQQTGTRLPIHDLYYWVRGLQAPGAVQTAKRDTYNHLTYLQQAGYTIEYGSYTSVNGVDLPSRVRLQGHGLMVKLVIKHWAV